jgi:hypothetical protein
MTLEPVSTKVKDSPKKSNFPNGGKTPDRRLSGVLDNNDYQSKLNENSSGRLS